MHHAWIVLQNSSKNTARKLHTNVPRGGLLLSIAGCVVVLALDLQKSSRNLRHEE